MNRGPHPAIQRASPADQPLTPVRHDRGVESRRHGIGLEPPGPGASDTVTGGHDRSRRRPHLPHDLPALLVLGLAPPEMADILLATGKLRRPKSGNSWLIRPKKSVSRTLQSVTQSVNPELDPRLIRLPHHP